MIGLLVLALFCICGYIQIRALCPRRPGMIKLWLGAVLGLMELMWLPSLFAFLFGFTMAAQSCAIITECVITGLLSLLFLRKNRPAVSYRQPSIRLTLLLMIPVTILCAYLHYTHTLQEIDGAYYVGQSTYGDLCMHLSFITGIPGQSYPPEYTILPGTTLGYPFLVDALSSTLYMFGLSLSMAVVIPGTLMTVLVYLGFFLFAYELTKNRGAAVLSLVFLLFCGGLGFLYTLDMSGKTAFEALNNALYGYYQAPANNPEHNLRWVNALCDLLIPQRTLLAGWLTVIPALYLLVTSIKSRRTGDFIALGLWSGPMVMIHTHSFLGLGVISLGALFDVLVRDKKHRIKQFLNFALYGIIAVPIALPQLLVWTFPQTIDGGSLKLLFNWVNNSGTGKLIDGYFWFWIKNVGPMFIFFPIAALSIKDRRVKAISLGSLLLFILAENVIFQPNVYDNNKLFFVSYLAMLPCGCLVVTDIYKRLKGIRLRALLAAVFIFSCTASGVISITREWISSYEIFSSGAVEASEWIKENTPEDCVFLTSTTHRNVPASLCGRKIVCGSSLYVYFHGLDYRTQEAAVKTMLSEPAENISLFGEYDIAYVYVSSFERSECNADEDALADMFELVYEGGEWYDQIRIYKVK